MWELPGQCDRLPKQPLWTAIHRGGLRTASALRSAARTSRPAVRYWPARMHRSVAIVLASMALVLAACGDDEDESDASFGSGNAAARSCPEGSPGNVKITSITVEGGDCAEVIRVLQDWADTSAPSPGPEGFRAGWPLGAQPPPVRLAVRRARSSRALTPVSLTVRPALHCGAQRWTSAIAPGCRSGGSPVTPSQR